MYMNQRKGHTTRRKKKKRLPLSLKISFSVVFLLLAVVIGLNIYVDQLLNRVHYDANSGQESDVDINSIQNLNIVLIGEEAIGSGTARGRSDALMMVSLNRKEKSLKLTSFMRDLYVDIPGHGKNKLNAAYALGGAPLVFQTLQQNFNLTFNGYVKVGFSDFEKIIDQLGGVEITLTADEAHYLNTTNYISQKRYRNVREGKQILNGNQALGYTRIRKRRAIDDEHDDFGRTFRQRTVLNAIFEKYKSKNFIELMSLLNQTASYISTDISKSNIKKYVKLFASLGINDLQTMRIPVDGAYVPQTVMIGRNRSSVLTFDSVKNNNALQQFLYGTETVPTSVDGSEVPAQ